MKIRSRSSDSRSRLLRTDRSVRRGESDRSCLLLTYDKKTNLNLSCRAGDYSFDAR